MKKIVIHTDEIGLFITTVRGKEGKGTGEIISVLKEVTEDSNLEESLEEELERLRNDRRFRPLSTGVSCMAFISFKQKNMIPSDTIKDIVTKMNQGHLFEISAVEKAYPVDYSCRVDYDEVKRLFHELSNRTPEGVSTYVVRCRFWLSEKLGNNDVQKIAGEEFGAKLKVDCTSPDLTILVCSFKTFLGVSMLIGYNENKEYNLKRLMEGSEKKNVELLRKK
eukprot:GHVP01017503.1.p1 GENE.GHVP01017503.1~~GHVP01017503.1.p1  ORF type:complete len:222 (-),score=46.13 GHVP01017503.1:726-1391(-)